jgi:hypothetical protein
MVTSRSCIPLSQVGEATGVKGCVATVGPALDSGRLTDYSPLLHNLV